MKYFLKKTFFFVGFLLLILCIGGIGGVLVDRYFLPYLTSLPAFAELSFLRKATEHVTVINKTEEIVVREDDSVEKIASQAATAVVNIIVLGRETKTADEALTDISVRSAAVETMSGVLLTNDGLVVTYGDKAPEEKDIRYFILLFDGTSHEAQFVGHDALANLNFFRLKESINTPAIALSNSDDARVGRRMIAIGNTFAEYQNRLSVGILENINRNFNLSGKTVASSEKWEGVFEMSLERPEKYVGGPAIGFNGEMIGLVGTLLIDNEIYSFLLPANLVRESLGRALAGTLTTRAKLGVYYVPITKAYALGQGLSRDRGALIYEPSGRRGLAVISNSPADRAGLKIGDIIIAVNGEEVNLESPLPQILSRLNTGDQAELLILRNGTEMKVSLEL